MDRAPETGFFTVTAPANFNVEFVINATAGCRPHGCSTLSAVDGHRPEPAQLVGTAARFVDAADTFLVDGIEMSNFVHPSWFEPFKHPAGTKYDHLGLLKKPFSMTKGGYVIIKKKGKLSELCLQGEGKRFAKEDDSAIAASIASRAAWSSSRPGVERQSSAGPLDRLGNRAAEFREQYARARERVRGSFAAAFRCPRRPFLALRRFWAVCLWVGEFRFADADYLG